MTRADKFVLSVKKEGIFAFDIEHPPHLDKNRPAFRLSGCSFATASEAFYSTDPWEISHICKTLFPLETVSAVAYNGKYDLTCLRSAELISNGEYPKNFIDPMIALNLIDDNRRPNQLGLKLFVKETFNHDMMDFETAWSFGEDSPEFAAYAVDDAVQELRVWSYLKPLLVKDGLDKLFHRILMPVTKVFADMELTGIGWDVVGANRLLLGYQDLRDSMSRSIKAEIGEINLNSGDQLSKRLFDELGYSTDGIEMTPSGKRFAVDAAAMDILAKRHPICKKIVTYRTAAKMINTYVEPLTEQVIVNRSGRVHPSYWLVSSTGRTRCENPNFQNIPAHLAEDFAHLNIRANVVPAAGRKLIVADLSQIELRLVAHIAKDKLFLKAYREWSCNACGTTGDADIILHSCPKCGALEDEGVLRPKDHPKHSKTGFYHGLDLHQMTTDNVPALRGNRQDGKTTNFALVYLASAKRMNYSYPQLSKNQWQAVIDQYFDVYTGVKAWHHSMEELLYKVGQTTDIFGRKRRIPRAAIKVNAKNALNMLVNFGPQASACGIMELAMTKLVAEWQSAGAWCNKVFITNMVHDELVVECDDDYVSEALPRLQYHLENSVRLCVPIRTSIKVCSNWAEK